MILLFLTSGLFLGWSLGANDASNVFGTAVGSKMLRFWSAAILCGLFVIIGAVVQGAGPSDTLDRLGSIDAVAGSFTVALSAAIIVFFMTKYAIPVSTSQAIVGAILGWNIYTGNATDYHTLIEIVVSWVLSPVLGAIFAALIYFLAVRIISRTRVHLLKINLWTKIALIAVGIFGSYSLGANNIANVMGVFVHSVDIPDLQLFGMIRLSGAQQLFFIGGVAIAIGVWTYSRRTMMTVGKNLMQLSSLAAIVVVLSHALVLFLFSSQSLQQILVSLGLPAIPLVPVSSSQLIVGAIIGIGLLKGGRTINFGIMGSISLGWIATPVAAALLCYFSLFFMENVFKQTVHQATTEITTKRQYGQPEIININAYGKRN